MSDHPFNRNGDKRNGDPTSNVLDLVDAANKRQDDLREANNRRLDSEVDHMERMAILRESHARELRDLESKRIDANRQFDQLSVKTESERAATAIKALADAATAIAETLRKQLADTFTAATDRIGKLEIASSEGKGKQAVADPMMEQLLTRVQGLLDSRAVTQGKSAGINASWVFAGALVALLVGLLTIGGVITAVVLYVAK